jgi:hypothetical protein
MNLGVGFLEVVIVGGGLLLIVALVVAVAVGIALGAGRGPNQCDGD